MTLAENPQTIESSPLEGAAWPYWVAGFVTSWASAFSVPEQAPEQGLLMMGAVALLFLWGLIRTR